MAKFSTAVAIATTSALLVSCGPSSPDDGAPRPGVEPRPTIGLLMDTLEEERWQRDRDLFVEFANEQRADVLVESAERDDAGQLELAQSLLDQGAQVLVVVPHSAEAAAQIVEAAKARAVPVIAYDRLILILNADVDLYMSYDNRRIGDLQAQTLRNLAPTGDYILLGGAETDHNAALIREGQMAALEGAVSRGEGDSKQGTWFLDAESRWEIPDRAARMSDWHGVLPLIAAG